MATTEPYTDSIARTRAASAALTFASSSAVISTDRATAPTIGTTASAMQIRRHEEFVACIEFTVCGLPLLTLNESRLAPIGMIGQVESFSWLDNERHFLAAC